MKDAEIIPVTIKAMSENGSGNLLLQFIAQQNYSLPKYSAGAHIDVYIPGIGPRQYSLCSEESQGDYYEVCVKLAEKSSGGSHHIHHNFKPGDSLSISAPRNHFPLPEAKRYLLLAGGIGITPLLAMAEEIATAGGEFELHYYVSNALQTAFLPRLSSATLADRVFLHYSDANDSLRKRTPHSLTKSDPQTRVIACGPDGFIQRLQEIMQQHHWQPDQFHFERFSNPESTNQTGNTEFHIELSSTGQRFLVSPERTIAEVLLSAKVDIMLSCEQGICGSCITDVISGIPEHRDCVLTDEEKAENTQITVCCSRAKTSVLVLDL